ncbi:hypothetical protein ACQPXS_13660 [Streptomyces sp. CA-142005]|uniref:hypothetical protein n=1 Tax=Streptomyces sp. CA-142005 TaxID=3240052 RepID=UPI003D90DA37
MAQAAAVAKPPAPPRRRRASATPRRLPYLLIAPAALLMLGFIAYPVLSVFQQTHAHRGPVGGATAPGTSDAVTGTGWTDDGEHDDRRDDEPTAGVSRRRHTPRGDPGTGR